MYRNAAIAFLLTSVRAVTADDNEKCFCPVEDNGASKACTGTPYKRISIESLPKDRCQEFCALEPDTCKGFARLDGNSDDNCLLYDSVPEVGDAAGVCFGLTGDFGGFVELPRRLTGGCGGVCGAPIYSSKDRCDFGDDEVEPFCNPPGSYIKAKSLQECKDWCEGRGNKCQGFDFDQGKADVCARNNGSSCFLSCYERRYKPTISRGITSSTRDNWRDEFCHARVCECGGPPPVARNPGWPEEQARCSDNDEWVSINPLNGDPRTCAGWVAVKPGKRCGKYGIDPAFDVSQANDACPSVCKNDCKGEEEIFD